MKHSFNGYAYFANWSTNKLMPRPPRPVFDLVKYVTVLAVPAWSGQPGCTRRERLLLALGALARTSLGSPSIARSTPPGG
jgi:hypothetical protein